MDQNRTQAMQQLTVRMNSTGRSGRRRKRRGRCQRHDLSDRPSATACFLHVKRQTTSRTRSISFRTFVDVC
jgi:hypothetical protein